MLPVTLLLISPPAMLTTLPSATAMPPPVADPAELAAMRRRLDDVEDGELRETLDRLGAAVLAESAARGED